MKKTISTILLLIFTAISCDNTENNVDLGPTYDRESLLNNWYNNHISPSFNNFSNELSQLKSQVEEAKSGIDLKSETLNTLRLKFIDTYIAWQYVEMFNIGKAEEIYYNSTMNIYPVNTARVKSNIDSENYDLSNPNNYAAQGLPTIDYILFGMGSNDIEILDKLNGDVKHMNYLSSVIDEMSLNTSNVINDWETFKNEFLGSTENTATSAVNMMVNDFIYYYEKGFRANKFGIPAGVFSSSPIPENIELYYASTFCGTECGEETLWNGFEDFNEDGIKAGVGKTLSIVAMKAMENFFNGAHSFNNTNYSGSSLKSILLQLDDRVGENNLGNRISNKLEDAKNKIINDLYPDYNEQIATNNNMFLQTYDAIQEVVVLLKVDMLQFLSINVDYVDADGD